MTSYKDPAYYPILEIYSFDKDKIKTEEKKFEYTARNAFLKLHIDVLPFVNELSPFNDSKERWEILSSVFTESVIGNSDIANAPYNPSILAFVFYSLDIFGDGSGYHHNIFYNEKSAKLFIKTIREYWQDESRHSNEFFEFLKTTGCTASNCIRYFIFLQNMFPRI